MEPPKKKATKVKKKTKVAKKATKKKTKVSARKVSEGNQSQNEKHELFCLEYIKDFNGTRAAIAAGYQPTHASKEQNRLRKNPKIVGRIAELMSQRKDALKIEAQDVLAKLWMLGTFDLAEVFDGEGKLLPIHEIPEDVRRCLAGIEIDETYEGFGKNRVWTGYSKKVRTEGRRAALRDVGQHIGMFPNKVDLSGSLGVTQLTDDQLDAQLEQLESEMNE